MSTIIAIILCLAVVAFVVLYGVGMSAKNFSDCLKSNCSGDCNQGRNCNCCKNNAGKR